MMNYLCECCNEWFVIAEMIEVKGETFVEETTIEYICKLCAIELANESAAQDQEDLDNYWGTIAKGLNS